ncbi:MAG: glutathione synthase/RimK-type ligase-like ATP-grasp enzyme [Paraglaciecola sp.]|jgi:glutathione synthase/RimK-type ligase-like ATP-grasp enzyme
MKRCAFLSMDSLEDFFSYDQMLFEPLKVVGWLAEEVSWRKPDVNWNDYDAVVIRTTWDYQDDVEGFLACLQRIEASTAVLQNSLKIVEWNISKSYLNDLQNQGINVVPTLWFDSFSLTELQAGFSHFDTPEIVLKPLISAGADHTYRLTLKNLKEQAEGLKTVFAQRQFMLQPFLPGIIDEGEYSLFYFAGHYSHSILKQPQSGDFRVQEEHGGQLKSIQPCEDMLTTARHCLAALPADVLYARIDLVRHNNEFAVIEIELIEPSLYFNMDAESPHRFVDAFVEML